MTDVDLDKFVATYSNDDALICFRWNGKHEDEFDDANEGFRSAVIDRVLNKSEDAPLSLLVDLYRALTQYSAEAWCIDERVEDLAKLMIKTGGAQIAREFIVGAMQSFDAQCATVFSGSPRDKVEECLKLTQSKLETKSEEDERALWEFGLENFKKLLKHAA
jgi:hypothetical protein